MGSSGTGGGRMRTRREGGRRVNMRRMRSNGGES